MKTVVVGMSGGVDSSVSALLLKQQGYRTIGLFMKNWEEKGEGCSAAYDYEDVVKVSERIGIPCYAVNFAKEYWETVFQPFLEDFSSGLTPNPDILCNREIKFQLLLQKALELGADYLATGHYCQIGSSGNWYTLERGADSSKDQTYFLYAIKPQVLAKVLFPIGGMLKSEVRRIAREFALETADKKDSTGICFIGKRPFKSFLRQYLDAKPGNFETLEGQVVGRHDGAFFYTIGQRKGMGIGGAGDAWYVCGKDMQRNVIFVVQGENHPALFCQRLTADQLNWITPIVKFPYRCTAKIRYRQPDSPCTITSLSQDCLQVDFDHPQRAVTPRQSIVFYDGGVCLGGGMIRP